MGGLLGRLGRGAQARFGGRRAETLRFGRNAQRGERRSGGGRGG